jgi:Zn-dependent protease
MDPYNFIITVAVFALPVIFAITLHEAAHGYVARHFGDTTAYMLGRVTLNPLKHIDLIGTIILPLVTVLLSGFMFGWAKPVPVNERNLRNPKRDMMWVAAAGPGSNVAQALAWAGVAKLLMVAGFDSRVGDYWFAVAVAGIQVNVVFAILNLFPLLPLDGGRIVVSLLPGRASYGYARLEPYGMIVLVILIMTGALSYVLSPLVGATLSQINKVMGLP